jgi:hypothetical protein
MFCNASDSDYRLNTVSLKNISMGLIQRSNGHNNDLALKKTEDCLVGFAGYGKFAGEETLCWADEMIEKIIPEVYKNGHEILTQIEGSFLCAIYYHDEFMMVSDRFGSKSCYLYHDDTKILFAPSVTALMDFGLIRKEKNLRAVTQVLISGFFLDDSTLVNDVRRFPSATVFKGRINGKPSVKEVKYWEMPQHEGVLDTINTHVLNTFKEKMQHAIYELNELEPKSVIPLSGGLDSRAIACFLSRKQNIKTITYDFGDEAVVADKVCRVLKGEPYFFTKQMIGSVYFKNEITKQINQQNSHSVSNQYFYAPLFRRYFMDNTDYGAIYDGVYLDILFSAPYTYHKFDFQTFITVYGGSMEFLINACSMKKEHLVDLMLKIYDKNIEGFKNSDGVAISQQCYMAGRLRRYVSESYSSRENYCYVFKPGYNYDVMDFGFSLSLNLRKGLLYTTLLNQEFPDVMKIRYKDSYGNREKTRMEEIEQWYRAFRLKLSSASRGFLKYFPYQADYYFLHEHGIDEFKELLMNDNYIKEIIDNDQLLNIYGKVKQKQYLLNQFNRILFIQQFYHRNHFSE